MSRRFTLGGLAASALAAGALWAPVTAVAGHNPARRSQAARRADVRAPAIKLVLVISVDGMLQSDLAWYVRNHPGSELARLAGHGAQYADAQTQVPSDSFPGTVGIFTGGDPRVTGVY
jgi:predicted AlkP superfamily pyrophosphatase or phosphodiesterase